MSKQDELVAAHKLLRPLEMGIKNTFNGADWINWQADAPETPWLIEGFLKPGTISLIVGEPTMSYKTWAALAVATAIARGEPVFGLKPVGGPQKVWFIEAESPGKGFAQRFKAIEKGIGQGFGYDFLDDNMLISHQPELRLEHDTDRMLEFVEEQGIKFVVMDTYAAMSDLDENDAGEAKKINKYLERFRGAGCAVLLIHHTTKNTWGSGESYNASQSVRGSGAIVGTADILWTVRCREGSPDNTKIWEIKSNEFGKKYYQATWHIDSSDDGGTATRAILDFEKLESLGAFSSLDLDTFLEQLLHGETYGIKALAGAWDVPQKIARKIADTLTKECTLDYDPEKKKWLYA